MNSLTSFESLTHSFKPLLSLVFIAMHFTELWNIYRKRNLVGMAFSNSEMSKFFVNVAVMLNKRVVLP